MITVDEEHQEEINAVCRRIETLAVDFARLTPFLGREESLSFARDCVDLASARNDLLKLALPWDNERQPMAEAVEEAAVAAMALLLIAPEGNDDDVDRLTGRAVYYSVCAKIELGLVCGEKLDPTGATHLISAISLCRTRAEWAKRHQKNSIAVAWLILAASIYNRMSNDLNWPASITWRNALSLSEQALECADSQDGRDLARSRVATYASLLVGIDSDPSYSRRVEKYGGVQPERSAGTLPFW